MVIIFFWLDLTTDPFYHGKFMGVMKIPTCVIITLILIMEISLIILRNFVPITSSVVVAVYLILNLILAIFEIIAGHRIIKPLRKQADGKKKQLWRITVYIIISAVVTIAMCILFILFLIASGRPQGSIILFFLLWLAYFFQSLFIIMIFTVPKDHKSSSSAKSTKDSKESGSTKDISFSKDNMSEL